MTAVGKPFDRVDARKKVTGTATYANEVAVANVAYGVIVGAAISNGSIKSIDRKAAEASPGVFAVLTHDNAPKIPGAAAKPEMLDSVMQLLQDDKVSYADQPVAFVIADSLERAQHAATLVTVSYAAGTPPLAGLAASKDPYKPEAEGPAGVLDTERGTFATAFASAPTKIEQTYTTPVETHNPMEPHATTAVWQGHDHLTIYDATQGVFSTRARMAGLFGLAKENVRVINHYVGGGFGSKGSVWPHGALAAMGARVIGRPVKVAITRQQMQSLVGHRSATSQRVSLACDAKGKLAAMRHEVMSETSRFDEFVEPSAALTRFLYSCPNVTTTHRLVRLDVPTPTFTRGPGHASGSYALESAMDELSYAAGIDPLQLRIINHATTDEDKGTPYSSKSLLACYSRAAEKFGWAKRAKKPRASRDGRWLVGVGMATATYPALQVPSSAMARRRADGTYLVQAGTQDIGTGTYTIMTQIAADALGVPFEQVTFELGDTVLPETPISAGSFTASSTGSAVKMACLELKKKLEARGTSDNKNEEITATYKTEPNKFMKEKSMHSFGAAFAEVRVDEDLGIVRLSRFTGAYAAGKILNPKTARNQFVGGIVWGVGMALTEHAARDERTARMMTRDLADYHVPVNADIPELDVIMIEEDDPFVNALGVKGIGEISITGVAAAIANAVFHATGKRVRDLPIRLDDLLDEVPS